MQRSGSFSSLTESKKPSSIRSAITRSMTNTPNYDAKVKAILDATTPGERVCALTGEKWMMTEEEIGWYRKFNVPPHPWSPFTRMKYLMGFPSGISIWKKPHAETGKEILTFIHPDSPYKIIEDREWFDREFAQEERELDSLRLFFDQFTELAYSIPVGARRDEGSMTNTVGIDVLDSHDCYLVFGGFGNRRMQYGSIIFKNSDSVMNTNVLGVSDTYHCNATENMHNCTYCFQCGNCVNSSFLFNCDNMEDCFGATTKSRKRFIFFNEQLSEGEYRKRVSELDLRSYRVWQETVGRFHKLVREEGVWRPKYNFQNDDVSQGEYLMRCTRVFDAYWHDGSTDVSSSWMGVESRDSYSSMWTGWGSRGYLSCDLAYYDNVKYCMRTWRVQNMEYCMDCYDCENCFGCVGLRHKKFHIFNKPYVEEAYWKKLDELKFAMLERGEYGQFFPARLSQAGFQFSMGDFFIGYSKEDLERFDAPAFDPTRGNVESSEGALLASELPDHLDEINPDIHLGKPILDE